MKTMSPGMEERPDRQRLHLSNAQHDDLTVNPHEVDVQWGVDGDHLPSESQISGWVVRTLELLEEPADVEVSIRVVDASEMAGLNERYRHKAEPTNVLSFPVGIEDEDRRVILGDLVLCADVVIREAEQQHKSLEAHFAHMLVHGLLHLRGYDHVAADQAEEMERLEIYLMEKLGFSNPYEGGEASS